MIITLPAKDFPGFNSTLNQLFLNLNLKYKSEEASTSVSELATITGISLITIP